MQFLHGLLDATANHRQQQGSLLLSFFLSFLLSLLISVPARSSQRRAPVTSEQRPTTTIRAVIAPICQSRPGQGLLAEQPATRQDHPACLAQSGGSSSVIAIPDSEQTVEPWPRNRG